MSRSTESNAKEWSITMAEMALEVMSKTITDIGSPAITIQNQDAATILLAALIRKTAELAARDAQKGTT